MNRPILKALAITLIFAVMLSVGCGPQEPPSVKKSRTIAAENIELKKQLEKSEKKLEMLKAQYSKDMHKQREQLKKCLREKETLKEKSRQDVRDQVSSVLDTVMEENKKLRAENTSLKAQIEEMQK